VLSQEGTGLGKIEDVVLHPGGKPSYAVMSFGDWHGVGDKLFAMPWGVLRTVEADTAKKDSVRSLVLPLTTDKLKAAPGFDKGKWPVVANAEWTLDIEKFYIGDANPNYGEPVEAAARASNITWRVTELKGFDVTTPTGQELGELRDVAIDTNGRVCYATLSVGGFLGIGDRVVAVPWDSLNFSVGGTKGDERKITLAVTKKLLELAPEFKSGKENCAEMCDPKWVQRVYTHYSSPAYWNRTGALEAPPAKSKN
jgi:sporulation protein YlmC with PRC-barrel domain